MAASDPNNVINLNKARKAQAKRDEKARAAENRVKFGTPKALRESQRKDAARSIREIDGKKLED